MIIELSNRFDDLLENDPEPGIFKVIEHLLDAHKYGHHFFIPTRRSAQSILRKREHFSTIQIATLQAILDRYAFYAGLARETEITVLVLPTSSPLIPECPNQLICLDLGHFAEPSSINKTRFLFENADNDGAFYQALCDCLATELGFTKAYKLNVDHGGGSSVGKRYEEFSKSPHPTLCIVDSDKKHYADSYGDTAKNVVSLKGKELFPTTCCEALSVREAENLIPLEISREIFDANPAIQSALSKIERLEKHDENQRAESRLLPYFDFKSGLKRSDISSQESAATRDHLLNVWRVIDPNETDFDVVTYGVEDEIIVTGVSQNMLPQFSEFSQKPKNRARIRAALKRTPLWEEARSLVSLVMALAASPEVARVY